MSLSYCGWSKAFHPLKDPRMGLKFWGVALFKHAKLNSLPEPQLLNGLSQFPVFLLCPQPLSDVRSDFVPSLTAVFVCAAWQQDGNVIPVLDTAVVAHCQILIDELVHRDMEWGDSGILITTYIGAQRAL